VSTKLQEIAKVARLRPTEKFTSLAHLIDEERITICHEEMLKGKAVGVDEVTKEEYAEDLDRNVKDLIKRMKRNAYRPQPVKRVHIPKAGSDKKRPLGIPAYEDKLVQTALAKILSAIYEQQFMDSSFGFRPNRNCHDALKVLNEILHRRPINYVVDVDIKGFFDNVNHKWMMEFIKHRIEDPNILRLIGRFLRAGVVEAGVRYDTPEGTPQGGPISPILANIYLHYVVDLWFEKKMRRQYKGAAYMIRYADDKVYCFEHREEAEAFYKTLQERLEEFGLEISEDKSKIIAFGRRAGSQTKGKPETFDFLGFTHYCSKSQNGKFRVKRKTSRKKYKASLLKAKEWIRNNRHQPKDALIEELNRKLKGYYNYYGITDNTPMLRKYVDEVKRMLFKYLNRRSQRKSYQWDKFQLFMKKYPLEKPRVKVSIFELKTELSYIM